MFNCDWFDSFVKFWEGGHLWRERGEGTKLRRHLLRIYSWTPPNGSSFFGYAAIWMDSSRSEQRMAPSEGTTKQSRGQWNGCGRKTEKRRWPCKRRQTAITFQLQARGPISTQHQGHTAKLNHLLLRRLTEEMAVDCGTMLGKTGLSKMLATSAKLGMKGS